jgi:hypothetical protein
MFSNLHSDDSRRRSPIPNVGRRFLPLSCQLILAICGSHVAAAQIQVLAVTDAATFTPGLPFAGSLATVFCTGLTSINGTQTSTSFPLPYQIAGVSVTVSGTSAPLLAVDNLGGYQQINFQVPPLPGLSGIFGSQTIEVSQSSRWVDALPIALVRGCILHGSIRLCGRATWGLFGCDCQSSSPSGRSRLGLCHESGQPWRCHQRPVSRPAGPGRALGDGADVRSDFR